MLNITTFNLIKGILAETPGLHLNFFEGPDADLGPIDCNIRVSVYPFHSFYDHIRSLPLDPNKITVVEDELYLKTLLFPADATGSAFYSLGPFRSQPYDSADLAQVQENTTLSDSGMEHLKTALQPLPFALPLVTALSIAAHITEAAHGQANPEAEFISIAQQITQNPNLILQEDINVQAKRVEEIYEHEDSLLSAVAAGNETKALQEAQFFMRLNINQRFQPVLRSQRQLMYSVNTLFRKTAQSVGIHPLFVDRINQHFVEKLLLSVTGQQMNAIYFEMIKDYCALCRDHSTQGHSENVQKILHYVQFNLRDDLTPTTIADAVGFSPNYISRLFKEEMGTSLINYITDQRIHVACQLLKSTNMTVKEIASYVGIPDWNYFTKLFKKSEGCTPKEYRQK